MSAPSPYLDTGGADFLLTDAGSLVLLEPVSWAGHAWAEEHLPEDAPRWGRAFAIERRYAFDVLAGLTADGLGLA